MAPDRTLGKNSRLYLLGAILLLWCVAICGRLVYLQVFSYGKFVKQAGHQQQRAIPLVAKRGVIYDRAGRELAMSVLVDSAFAVPSEVKDLPTAVSLVTRITGEDRNVVLADCQAHKTFCWVARKADDETIERIKSLNLQGIHFQKEPKRFYPARDLAAQVLGSVGMEDSGQSGIEHEFDDELAAVRGRCSSRWTRASSGSPMLNPARARRKPRPDHRQEHSVHRRKRARPGHPRHAGHRRHRDRRESAYRRNSRRWPTGPTFNPNLRKQITPAALTNRAVSYIYEPGSTFKLVTISAALEEKLTNPNEVFDCQMGAIVYNGMRIRDSKPHGLLPVWGVLAESSDVGSIKIALRLGEDRYYKYIRAFGFGQQTGIELPGETRGMTKPPSRWSKVSIAAISIGRRLEFRRFSWPDWSQRSPMTASMSRRASSRAPSRRRVTANRHVSSGRVASRDFVLHRRRDALDDGESRARSPAPAARRSWKATARQGRPVQGRRWTRPPARIRRRNTSARLPDSLR